MQDHVLLTHTPLHGTAHIYQCLQDHVLLTHTPLHGTAHVLQ